MKKLKYAVGEVVKWKVWGGWCYGTIECIVQTESGSLYQVPNAFLKKEEKDLFPLAQKNKSAGK